MTCQVMNNAPNPWKPIHDGLFLDINSKTPPFLLKDPLDSLQVSIIALPRFASHKFWLTNKCFGDLIDVTLADEDAYSKAIDNIENDVEKSIDDLISGNCHCHWLYLTGRWLLGHPGHYWPHKRWRSVRCKWGTKDHLPRWTSRFIFPSSHPILQAFNLARFHLAKKWVLLFLWVFRPRWFLGLQVLQK